MNKLSSYITNYPSSHIIACWFVIGVAITPIFSPAVASLLEALLVLVVLFSAPLRTRVIQAWHQPLVKAALVLYTLISISTLYSIAPPYIAIAAWVSWRKLLLLPLALALFDAPLWKKQLSIIMVGLVTLLAIISLISWSINYRLTLSKFNYLPGILLRDHITQGMMFSTGAFIAVVWALHSQTLKMQLMYGISAVVLSVNSVLVTTGRSGYVALSVFMLVTTVHYLYVKQASWPKIVLGAICTVTLMAAILFVSPTSHERITLGMDEVSNYTHQSPQGTSMGQRIVFWKNALVLIADRPLLGLGTGGFGSAYNQLVAGRAGAEGIPVDNPHNQYLKMAAEHGLIGLMAFLGMLIAAVKQRPTGAPIYRLLGLGVMAAWMATSLVNSHFSDLAEGTFIYVWLGAMLAENNVLATATTAAPLDAGITAS